MKDQGNGRHPLNPHIVRTQRQKIEGIFPFQNWTAVRWRQQISNYLYFERPFTARAMCTSYVLIEIAGPFLLLHSAFSSRLPWLFRVSALVEQRLASLTMDYRGRFVSRR